MAKPQSVTISKRDQNKIKSLYVGTKKREPITAVSRLTEEVGVPRRQVMLCLEENDLKWFGHNSYA